VALFALLLLVLPLVTLDQETAVVAQPFAAVSGKGQVQKGIVSKQESHIT